MTRIGALAMAALAFAPVLASAQAAAPATAGPTTRWSAQAGYERFALRDISRTIRPPDASPIAWRGTGPAIIGHLERTGLRVAHLADVLVARAGAFTYASPTREDMAMRDDSSYRFDARYEYRRYFFPDALIRGLDVGVGGQLIATRSGFDRHVTTALWTRTRISGAGLGGVAAIRWRRWDRVHITAAWTNGSIVSRRESEHSANPGAPDASGGGNWFTDTVVIAEWRLGQATRLATAWRRGFENYSSHHYHYAARKQAFTLGVSYAR
jgi:hypothetical protein